MNQHKRASSWSISSTIPSTLPSTIPSRSSALATLIAALLLCLAPACSSDADPRDPPDVEPEPMPPVPPGPAADALAELAALPAVCSPDQWCWTSPSPSGNDYLKVYSTTPDNLWLIGQHGLVMQWNGTSWKLHRPEQPAGHSQVSAAYAIAGRAADDMWLLIGATVQHWDGEAWKVRDQLPPNGLQSFNSIWQAPNGDVWVTMSTGQVSRSLAGGNFERIDTGCDCFLGSIWGLASDEFWMTSLPGNILRSDGKSFTPAYTGGTPIGSFTGIAKNDVWVSGSDGAMLHWDGAAWTAIETGLDSGFLGAATALASDDVWWWWASNSSASSAFVHWDGTSLTTTPVDTSALGVFLYSASIIDGTWWIVGAAGAVYTRTSAGAITPIVDPQVINLQSMWGTSIDELYYATGGRILEWNGTSLATLQPVIAASSISGVATARGNELFGVGFEVSADQTAYIANAFHYDGTSWTKSQLERAPIAEHRYFTKVWAMAPGEAMAVGYGGIAYYFSGGVWNRVATDTTADLMGVWGPSADQLWITGTGGTLLEWERARPGVAAPDPSWTTTEDLGPIHGAGGLVWIAAGANEILRGNTTGAPGWTQLPAGMQVDSVFAVSDDDVVISSATQSLLKRWNGSAFVQEDNASALPTPVLFQPPGGPMFAGGLKTLVSHQ